VLKLPERLAAWYIIHSSYADRAQHATNPFLSLLVKAAGENSARSPVERNLVLQLLQGDDLAQVSLVRTVHSFTVQWLQHLEASLLSHAHATMLQASGCIRHQLIKPCHDV
jgi:hypothetical protein